MDDKQFDDAFTAIGGWFFLVQYEEIVDFIGDTKDLVDHIFTNRNDNLKGRKFDSKKSGTQTRVSSALRLIRNKRDKEALEKIRDSQTINSQHPEAKELAYNILAKRFK